MRRRSRRSREAVLKYGAVLATIGVLEHGCESVSTNTQKSFGIRQTMGIGKLMENIPSTILHIPMEQYQGSRSASLGMEAGDLLRSLRLRIEFVNQFHATSR